ncbi:hypothetical protein H257_11995 [Aphanomyces astaci]|uniref:Uncharacterized protein n=1 Tax=Aphanomyces astaci TaxID=112090 RepID=W4G2M5_APHAT|nr:hypothetical protein H257_11995 [Aphanomyces astaci]ETV73183.1 hypothetical protein H257_11995 [Aphanomyces astaci]|eukprot:XP_009837388.1 hypothetical protein H257_11995 [Aphanomyces astaci]
MKNLMQSFNISQQTISRIWRRGCETAASLGVAKFGSKKKGRCGRPRKYKDEDVQSAVTSAPAHLRRLQNNGKGHWCPQDGAVAPRQGQKVESAHKPSATIAHTTISCCAVQFRKFVHS